MNCAKKGKQRKEAKDNERKLFCRFFFLCVFVCSLFKNLWAVWTYLSWHKMWWAVLVVWDTLAREGEEESHVTKCCSWEKSTLGSHTPSPGLCWLECHLKMWTEKRNAASDLESWSQARIGICDSRLFKDTYESLLPFDIGGHRVLLKCSDVEFISKDWDWKKCKSRTPSNFS